MPAIDLKLFDLKAHNPAFVTLKSSGNKVGALYDFCVPVNPGFPSLQMQNKLHENLEEILRYYPRSQSEMIRDLSHAVDIEEKYLALGNGSTELITWIDHLFVKGPLLTPVPTFGRWTDQPSETGKKLFTIRRLRKNNFHLDEEELFKIVKKEDVETFVLCNPNNPTGAMLTGDQIYKLLKQLGAVKNVIIDESFIDFSDRPIVDSASHFVEEFENLIVLKSLGKNFGLHGVRLGYTVSNARRAQEIRNSLPKWNINGVGDFILRNFSSFKKDYMNSLAEFKKIKGSAFRMLSMLKGVKVYPSAANFFFLELEEEVNGIDLRNRLIKNHACFIRECSNKIGGSSQMLRIAIRPQEEMRHLVIAMQKELGSIKRSC